MAINTYVRNRFVAYKKAAATFNVDYDELKKAYNAKTVPEDENMRKAVNMVHAILRNYGKARTAVAAEVAAEAPAELPVEAE